MKHRKIEIYKGELAISIGLILVSIFLGLQTFQFPDPVTDDDVGPALLPQLLFSALIVSAMILIIRIVRRPNKQTIAFFTKETLAVTAILVLYPTLVYLLGFIVATPLILIVLARSLGIKNWILTISYAGILTLLLWFIFIHILNIPLP